MKFSYLYLGNDHTIVLEELEDDAGSAVTDADVTVDSLVDSDGEDVAGISLPITLAHDTGGTYKGTLSKDIVIAAGSVYKAVVTAVSGGLQGQWTETLLARVRQA